ncbi:MAG: hypothetical protein ITG02_02395 [Patulibacter sp.]|nr:hypothetical protein [Patulibacter sp.]
MLPDTIWADSFGWYPHEEPGAHEYARATPSVRLARWLDQDPDREHGVAMDSTGEWVAALWLEPNTTAKGIVGRGATRDAALSAALDQAEGVRDAGH